MNRKLFLAILSFFLILSPPQETQAQESNSTQSGITIIKTVTMVDYHDPGWMLMIDKNGKEYKADFFYEFIKFDNISEWADETGNVTLDIVDTPDNGIGIIRHADSTFYKVVFTADETPIDELMQPCFDEAPTTLAIMQCYDEEVIRWKAEQTYLLQYIDDNGSDALREAVKKSQDSWEQYTKDFFDAYSVYAGEMTGTKHLTDSLGIYAAMQKDRAMKLTSFFPLPNDEDNQ